VTGLTISKEQHDFAKERMYREGLNEKVEIVMRDYRDEGSRYDGIASIEMFEAVGEAYWPAYFNTVRDRLNPGAIAGLQIITVSDHIFDSYRKSVDFIQKYIFPGGMLPSKQALSNQFDQADLMVTEMLEFGDSYSETLRRWYKDFNQSWSQIEPLGFDDRFRRMWNFYLAAKERWGQSLLLCIHWFHCRLAETRSGCGARLFRRLERWNCCCYNRLFCLCSDRGLSLCLPWFLLSRLRHD